MHCVIGVSASTGSGPRSRLAYSVAGEGCWRRRANIVMMNPNSTPNAARNASGAGSPPEVGRPDFTVVVVTATVVVTASLARIVVVVAASVVVVAAIVVTGAPPSRTDVVVTTGTVAVVVGAEVVDVVDAGTDSSGSVDSGSVVSGPDVLVEPPWPSSQSLLYVSR